MNRFALREGPPRHVSSEGIAWTFSELMKGVPQAFVGLGRKEVAVRGASLLAHDLPFPVATLRRSALQKNSAWFNSLIRARHAYLSPHGKTSMSPELFELQADEGCWALTLATFHQVRVARAAGWRRILLANEAVGKQELDFYIAQLNADPSFDFYLYVDSVQGVERICEAVRRHGARRPMQVLLEVGYANGRCGVRAIDGAIQVCEQVNRAPDAVALVGVAGFEGLNQYGQPSDREANARAFLRHMAAIAREIDGLGYFHAEEVILSAGGSAFYDLVLDEFAGLGLSKPTRIVVRSGCYLTHDNLMYRALQGEVEERLGLENDGAGVEATGQRLGRRLQPALEVWGQVVSAPDPQTVILGAGRRDFGQDAGNPIPLRWHRACNGRWGRLPARTQISMVSDQHTNITLETGHSVSVGDLVSFGVSHPCTTFDKWQVIYVIDDEGIVVDAVRTWF